MKLAEEIFKILGGEDPARISYTVTDGGGGYFRNVKRLLEFSACRLVLKGRKGSLSVEGENLSIGKYFAGDLEVRGKITGIWREN